MNDRIQELAEQAALLGPSSRVGNAHEATEKFAELIIKDVLSIIDIIATDHYNADEFTEHLNVDWVGTVIKRHYGLDKDFSGCFLCGQENPTPCNIFKCPTTNL